MTLAQMLEDLLTTEGEVLELAPGVRVSVNSSWFSPLLLSELKLLRDLDVDGVAPSVDNNRFLARLALAVGNRMGLWTYLPDVGVAIGPTEPAQSSVPKPSRGDLFDNLCSRCKSPMAKWSGIEDSGDGRCVYCAREDVYNEDPAGDKVRWK
jgi:hypothetical protein